MSNQLGCLLFLIWLLPINSWHAYDRHKHDLWKRNKEHCVKDYTLHHLLYHENVTSIETSLHEHSEIRDHDSKDKNSSRSTVSHESAEDFAEYGNCPCYHEATRPYPYQFIEELSLWPYLMNQFDIATGETIYGSQLALELIWKNQNPPDCKKAKYLISEGWPYGFGSRIHMEGLVLAAAVNLGRVYLPHPDGDNIFWETKIPFCRQRDHPDESLTCFYESFSKCTIEDALFGTGARDVNGFKSYSLGHFKDSFESEEGLRRVLEMYQTEKAITVVMTSGLSYDGHHYIPHQVMPLLHCSPMQEDFYYYWWRAISATYIARPNEYTKRILASLSTNRPFNHHDQDQCIAMFVRHGDKGIEMKLLDLMEYLQTATNLWQRGLVPKSFHYLQKSHLLQGSKESLGDSALDSHHHEHSPPSRRHRTLRGSDSEEEASNTNTTSSYLSRRLKIIVEDEGANKPISAPLTSSSSSSSSGRGLSFYDFVYSLPTNGTLFITTEDAQVLQQAEVFGEKNHWKIIYTNLFDRTKQTAAKTWDEQHKRGSVAVHDDLEYLSMLFNLHLSSQCEAWVCTLASNSCRIMDELRATVGAKANRYYADISKESCEDVPCVADHGRIKTFGE